MPQAAPASPAPADPASPPVQTAAHPEASTGTFAAFSERADYSLLEALRADPQATADGDDHRPRQVFSGHYVPVTPTPLPEPAYVAHSSTLFAELGLSEALVHDQAFRRLFSGDISVARGPMRPYGWATGYALSIYGTEYTQQCPFGTGNGYGDGRAISVFEGVFEGRRWELQLKGGGPTPYCRGADGRAVLRSSVREFLAQELMHALGVPTSRSLTLYVSAAETVRRPWYAPESRSFEPDVLVDNPAAISTRVAPSFLRVGQLELFARRVRRQAHPGALEELRLIVAHLIDRHYRPEIDAALPFSEQVVALAERFRGRLIALVADWLRVGYCQGNFNSDNCAAGGFTLDYGPFGFLELFDPRFQPWTGGGEHFSFFNQPAAAEANYQMFWSALRPLLEGNSEALARLEAIREGFAAAMQQAIAAMWAAKLGLVGNGMGNGIGNDFGIGIGNSDSDSAETLAAVQGQAGGQPGGQAGGQVEDLVNELLPLLLESRADYTMVFRRLSEIAGQQASVSEQLARLEGSFYLPLSEPLAARWSTWLPRWQALIAAHGDREETSAAMKRLNPAITWREWLIAPAYEQAAQGDTSRIQELQAVFRDPYAEPPAELAATYDRLRPREFFRAGGVSHYSCSS